MSNSSTFHAYSGLVLALTFIIIIPVLDASGAAEGLLGDVFKIAGTLLRRCWDRALEDGGGGDGEGALVRFQGCLKRRSLLAMERISSMDRIRINDEMELVRHERDNITVRWLMWSARCEFSRVIARGIRKRFDLRRWELEFLLVSWSHLTAASSGRKRASRSTNDSEKQKKYFNSGMFSNFWYLPSNVSRVEFWMICSRRDSKWVFSREFKFIFLKRMFSNFWSQSWNLASNLSGLHFWVICSRKDSKWVFSQEYPSTTFLKDVRLDDHKTS